MEALIRLQARIWPNGLRRRQRGFELNTAEASYLDALVAGLQYPGRHGFLTRLQVKKRAWPGGPADRALDGYERRRRVFR